MFNHYVPNQTAGNPVQAVQVTDDNQVDLVHHLGNDGDWWHWVGGKGVTVAVLCYSETELEQWRSAQPTDWIVLHEDGQYNVVADSAFRHLYRPEPTPSSAC